MNLKHLLRIASLLLLAFVLSAGTQSEEAAAPIEKPADEMADELTVEEEPTADDRAKRR